MVKLLDNFIGMLVEHRIGGKELISRFPASYHKSIYNRLVKTKCTRVNKVIYYKGFAIDFYVSDVVVYYININGIEYNNGYDLSEMKSVEDVCEILDDMVDMYRHGSSYSFLRQLLLSAGVRKEDIIDISGEFIAYKSKDGSLIDFKVEPIISNERVKMINELVQVTYC